jgi:hypothetical protein
MKTNDFNWVRFPVLPDMQCLENLRSSPILLLAAPAGARNRRDAGGKGLPFAGYRYRLTISKGIKAATSTVEYYCLLAVMRGGGGPVWSGLVSVCSHRTRTYLPPPTESNQAKPSQAKPSQAKPSQTKPNQTKPNQCGSLAPPFVDGVKPIAASQRMKRSTVLSTKVSSSDPISFVLYI